jgi:hypothetical protein
MAKNLNNELRGNLDEVRETDDSELRSDHESEERAVTQDYEMSDEMRLEMLRGSAQGMVLPNLPPIDGFHMCWLSTTNSQDPIHRRMQLGYTPVKPSEIPGYQFESVKSGEWAGCVGVNEMIAFKLPNRLYNEYMKEMHHRAPLREEAGINAIYEEAERQAKSINNQAQLLTDEGRFRVGQNVPEPNFV